VSWVYKRTTPQADDPIPRIRGVGQVRFDTWSVVFQNWIHRLGIDFIDDGEGK
jgi:hypothetical protein